MFFPPIRGLERTQTSFPTNQMSRTEGGFFAPYWTQYLWDFLLSLAKSANNTEYIFFFFWKNWTYRNCEGNVNRNSGKQHFLSNGVKSNTSASTSQPPHAGALGSGLVKTMEWWAWFRRVISGSTVPANPHCPANAASCTARWGSKGFSLPQHHNIHSVHSIRLTSFIAHSFITLPITLTSPARIVFFVLFFFLDHCHTNVNHISELIHKALHFKNLDTLVTILQRFLNFKTNKWTKTKK